MILQKTTLEAKPIFHGSENAPLISEGSKELQRTAGIFDDSHQTSTALVISKSIPIALLL